MASPTIVWKFFQTDAGNYTAVSCLNALLGVVVCGITTVCPLTILVIVVSAAAALGNGLYYHASLLVPLTTEHRATIWSAYIFWFIQECGLCFYSYIILERVLFGRQRTLFRLVFWFVVLGTFSDLMAYVALIIRAEPKYDTAIYLDYGYFGGIVLLEAWSAYFLLSTFFRARKGSKNLSGTSRANDVFQEVIRSTEIRAATLIFVGITRIIDHIVPAEVPTDSVADKAGQVDTFATAVEQLFPVIMMVDIIAARLSRLRDHKKNLRLYRNIQNTLSTRSTGTSHVQMQYAIPKFENRFDLHLNEEHTPHEGSRKSGEEGSDQNHSLRPSSSIKNSDNGDGAQH